MFPINPSTDILQAEKAYEEVMAKRKPHSGKCSSPNCTICNPEKKGGKLYDTFIVTEEKVEEVVKSLGFIGISGEPQDLPEADPVLYTPVTGRLEPLPPGYNVKPAMEVLLLHAPGTLVKVGLPDKHTCIEGIITGLTISGKDRKVSYEVAYYTSTSRSTCTVHPEEVTVVEGSTLPIGFRV
jgi:hypothetical protein